MSISKFSDEWMTAATIISLISQQSRLSFRNKIAIRTVRLNKLQTWYKSSIWNDSLKFCISVMLSLCNVTPLIMIRHLTYSTLISSTCKQYPRPDTYMAGVLARRGFPLHYPWHDMAYLHDVDFLHLISAPSRGMTLRKLIINYRMSSTSAEHHSVARQL